MNEKPACERCAFLDRHKDEPTGLCRINPPTADESWAAVWPEVQVDDWCGKFALPLHAWTSRPVTNAGCADDCGAKVTDGE